MLLARAPQETQTPGYGRVLDPEWIDLKLVQEWKTRCIEQHGEKCHNPQKINHSSPSWLIDTYANRLVPGEGILEFLALSYRWGVTTGFRTSQHMLEDLQRPGSLLQEAINGRVPPTIWHVMQLTRIIGERYLWVDAVCIVQDDEIHMMKELKMMGAIYASAKLTIVASDGDAGDGICGLRGISQPREFRQEVVPVFDREQIIFRKIPVFLSSLGCSPYFKRGWTYQEFSLSKRRLIFADQQVHWICSCEELHEDLIHHEFKPSSITIDRSLSLLSDILAGQPNFQALSALFSDYNFREFTYPEDAMPGLMGMLAILGRSFSGGFLYGLPEMCFDSALMWDCSSKDLERRKRSSRKHSFLQTFDLPSWSWIGWKSYGMTILREETYDLDCSTGLTFRTTPITQWYTHMTPNSGSKRPIRATWFEYVKLADDTSVQLPDEWTKEEFSPNKQYNNERYHQGAPDGLGKHVYRHSRIPRKTFWRPIPIASIDQHTSPFMQPQTPYISCITRRGWFETKTKTRARNSKYVSLLDESRKECGVLHLHIKADLSHFLEAEADGSAAKIELVAICLRSMVQGRKQRASPDRYGILWVEWENGVAYRKASGWVDKEKWEEHELEDIHLVLG